MPTLRSQLDGEYYILHDDRAWNLKIRQLPARKFDATTRTWKVPFIIENYRAMTHWLPGVAESYPKPTASGYRAEKIPGKDLLLIHVITSVENVKKCKQIPQYRSFNPALDGWMCRPTPNNIQYLKRAFPTMQWSPEAESLAQRASNTPGIMDELAKRRATRTLEHVELDDYTFTGTPYLHQVEAFKLARHRRNFGFFMEQGTGKTYLTVNEVADRVYRGDVNALLVVCPNSVKSTWEEELRQFLPADIQCTIMVWEAKTKYKIEEYTNQNLPREGYALKVLVMNVEALSNTNGENAAKSFIRKHESFMVVDESARIKSPSASRAKAAIRVGSFARVRRILSGVPITQGPLDLFSQFKFLDAQILGFSSYFSFRNHFAVLDAEQGYNRIAGYQNIEELTKLIEPYTYRVLKDDCLDLPPKIYQKVIVDLTAEQRRMYDEMKEEMQTQIAGKTISVAHAIVKVMRMQQIVGGFIPMVDDEGKATGETLKNKPIPGGNPKLDALLEIIEDLADGEKVIIWARFRAELKLIADTLRNVYGEDQVVEFHGGVSNLQRTANRHAFQKDEARARFFVGQPAAGGIGLTLTSSHTVVYYSNDHSLETRLQSEDRAHRIGQTKHVTYHDIVARNTSDARILSALRSKKQLADLITGDPSLSWL
jgi:SNF2 family DNA or RNA helicase